MSLRFLIPFVISGMLSGCMTSAEMAQARYEPTKGGRVRYINGGADYLIQKRRADAEKKMRDFCGGPYRITSESSDDRENPFANLNNWSVYFDCVAK